MNQPSAEKVDYLIGMYSNEVNLVVSSFFAWKIINNLAVTDEKVYRALNRNALSWTLVRHALIVTFHTVLGRIFDRNRGTLTIHKFLRECKNGIKEFSKQALEARRLRDANGVRPDWLDEYVATMYEPVDADFEALEQATKKYANIYASTYKPIRDKVVAHKEMAILGSTDSLYANTNIGEVEALLEFLYQVQRVVQELHANGRRTSLGDYKLREEDYQKDLAELMQRLVR